MARIHVLAGLVVAAGFGVAFAAARQSASSSSPASSSSAPVTVRLCDGKTQIALPAAPATAESGRELAGQLMAAWLASDPSRRWVDESAPQSAEALQEKRFQIQPPYDNRSVLSEGQGPGHPYGNFSEQDVVIWERETRRLVYEGAEIFHDARKLGSTVSVSCDMCHPDASNTHPETYPKYQTQIGRAVLLRDMINWCIEHPVRGPKLADDDPKMRALEAYIYAQRKGKELQYGRH
jgi:thiosulfate dehydrogenase